MFFLGGHLLGTGALFILLAYLCGGCVQFTVAFCLSFRCRLDNVGVGVGGFIGYGADAAALGLSVWVLVLSCNGRLDVAIACAMPSLVLLYCRLAYIVVVVVNFPFDYCCKAPSPITTQGPNCAALATPPGGGKF